MIAAPKVSTHSCARTQQWLAPGGLVFPDTCRLLVTAIEDGDYRRDKIDFWDNV